jgi:hypothetical protein
MEQAMSSDSFEMGQEFVVDVVLDEDGNLVGTIEDDLLVISGEQGTIVDETIDVMDADGTVLLEEETTWVYDEDGQLVLESEDLTPGD